MTSKQFTALDKAQQRIHLLTEGTFLAESRTSVYDLMLYDLHGFYVEVAFYKKTNKVAFFKLLQHTDALAPYLADIDLDSLLQELPF